MFKKILISQDFFQFTTTNTRIMKDKHYKLQVDNTFTIDKNTKIQIYFEKVFYMVYLWMDTILQIYMRITIIICRILSIYKTLLFTHFTVKNFWIKQFLLSHKSIMQVFTINSTNISIVHQVSQLTDNCFQNCLYSYQSNHLKFMIWKV